MRIIHLDQLTKDFFDNSFPGFNQPVKIESNLFETNVPILELKLDIDVEYLMHLADDIILNAVTRPAYPYETHSRFSNWSMKVLWSDGNVSTHLSDVYYKRSGNIVDYETAVGPSCAIRDYLKEKGFNIKLCMLSVFSPGGYLRPHRDITLSNTPLGYFWLPLNDIAENSFKIYPYGEVDINLGSLYLFNQENYVHAIKNNSKIDRKVLVGYIDNVSPAIDNIIKTNLKTKYFLTK